jgi:recombination protein RecA
MYFEDKKEEEYKAVSDSKQIGGQAREMTIATNMWNGKISDHNTLLVLISQQRNQFGSMHASLIPTGGKALLFNSSTIIKLFSTEAEAEQIKGQVTSGDKIFEEQIGRPVNWRVEKNKQAPQNRTGSYDFYYDGDIVGIDAVGEVLDYSEKYGVVNKGGAWYTIYDERLQGRPKAIAYLRENPEVFEKLKEELNGKL